MTTRIDYGNGIHAIDATYVRHQLAAIHLIVDSGRAAFVDCGSNYSLPAAQAALGELAQRQSCVIDRQQRQPRIGDGKRLLDHGADRPFGQHLAHIIVPVEALALERHEEHARRHRTRVGADRVELGIGALVGNTDRGAGF